MGETSPFRRRWRVTLLRLAVVVPVLVVAAWTFYVGSAAEMHRMQDPHDFTFGRALAIVAVAPVLWLITMGAALDHFVSEFGAIPVFLLHLAGIHITAFLGAVALGPGFGRNFPPLGEPYATLGLGSIALWILVGFVAAWLVRGSFPPGRWRARWRRSALAPQADVARVENAHDAH